MNRILPVPAAARKKARRTYNIQAPILFLDADADRDPAQYDRRAARCEVVRRRARDRRVRREEATSNRTISGHATMLVTGANAIRLAQLEKENRPGNVLQTAICTHK